MSLSEDQITQLAPDSSSVKAGQQLANNSKWVSKYVHEKAMWGDCQGSGKIPYRTMVDLQNIAFKCSCPSRKFPCKHGLGLLYLYARTPNIFEEATQLDEGISEWLEKRASKTETKEAKNTKDSVKAPDLKAQEKRVEEREKKVTSGLEELRTWLQDLIRNGIHQIPAQAHSFNQNIAARMVDAQAPGLANSLKRLSQLNYYQDSWQEPFLRKISSMYLLTEGYKNMAQTSNALQTDIRTLVGWSSSKEQVLEQDGISDTWLILAKEQEEEDRLTTERIWLYGFQSQQFALILNFYPLGQVPQHVLLAGIAMQAEVVFYPSAVPLRALIKQQFGGRSFMTPTGAAEFSALQQKVTDTVAAQPFIEQIPFIMEEARMNYQHGKWYLVDQKSHSLPILNPEVDGWRVMASSGGETFKAFFIHEPDGVTLLAYWISNIFYSLG